MYVISIDIIILLCYNIIYIILIRGVYLKAISIQNPWAHMMLCGEKTIEARSWKTEYRGDLLICSSAYPKIENTIPGHALMVVELIDCVPFEKKHLEAACLTEIPDTPCYAWLLNNFRCIYPFKVKGRLKFFNIEDKQIKYYDVETEDEADKWCRDYIVPLLYKKRGKKC